jgi:translation initiation factor 3 subunit D
MCAERGSHATVILLSDCFLVVVTYMASFSLPQIHDNTDGSWGPSSSNLPETFKFKDIPYAPYSKSDKLGRFADWNDLSGDNRQAASGTTVNPRTGTRGRRDGAQTFGSGLPSAFSFQVEDESSFSLVDNKAGPPRRGGAFARGRATNRGTNSYGSRASQRSTRGGFTVNRGTGQRGARRGWRDWEKVSNRP